MSNDVLKKTTEIGDMCIDYVDSGKFYRQPVKILYYLFSIVTLGFPIVILTEMVDAWDYLRTKDIIMSILYLIIGIFVAVCSFYLWIKRAKSLNMDVVDNSRFIALPVLANIIQTIGEWLFILIGIGGFLMSFVAMLFVNGVAVASLIGTPIVGYLVCLMMRFLAESTKSIAHIANNTDVISRKLDK